MNDPEPENSAAQFSGTTEWQQSMNNLTIALFKPAFAEGDIVSLAPDDTDTSLSERAD